METTSLSGTFMQDFQPGKVGGLPLSSVDEVHERIFCIAPIMENGKENHMEHEMETGVAY